MTQQMFTVMFHKLGLGEDDGPECEGNAIFVAASKQHAIDHIKDTMTDYTIVATKTDGMVTKVICTFEDTPPTTYFVIEQADYVG